MAAIKMVFSLYSFNNYILCWIMPYNVHVVPLPIWVRVMVSPLAMGDIGVKLMKLHQLLSTYWWCTVPNYKTQLAKDIYRDIWKKRASKHKFVFLLVWNQNLIQMWCAIFLQDRVFCSQSMFLETIPYQCCLIQKINK